MINPNWLKTRADEARKANTIDPALYRRFNVKRGLRNEDGTGVLVGLTTIGAVHGYVVSEGEKLAVPGQLFYRGVDVYDLVKSCEAEHRFGFEEAAYLLLFGALPTKAQLEEWQNLLAEYRRLPDGFKENAIIRSPGKDIMNSIARAVLMGYTYDTTPDLLDIETCLRQSVELIAGFPTIAAYAYQAKSHYHLGRSLMIRYPDPTKSTAENLLMLIREDGQYTQLEAETLDRALILHAEHGGGNNSTFTTHVVTSSFTDTYSAIASATLALKGSRHGGANLRVMRQMDEIKKNVADWTDEGALADYLAKILKKQAGDGTGLVYGLGHAVYTLSDPRAVILKEKARSLAEEDGRMDEFELYDRIERLGPEVIRTVHPGAREVCANVDLYSGFVYDMLNIPKDLYTPLFAVGRVPGWCAHRMEELTNTSPIIRPAYKPIFKARSYTPLADR
ncbi:MAG: citrate/2-methylcitrate synthase [Kiritimatiellae bacterium]|nr:citrate/2-methylcitrate synthase [Kiritimatiellia bacterium]